MPCNAAHPSRAAVMLYPDDVGARPGRAVLGQRSAGRVFRGSPAWSTRAPPRGPCAGAASRAPRPARRRGRRPPRQCRLCRPALPGRQARRAPLTGRPGPPRTCRSCSTGRALQGGARCRTGIRPGRPAWPPSTRRRIAAFGCLRAPPGRRPGRPQPSPPAPPCRKRRRLARGNRPKGDVCALQCRAGACLGRFGRRSKLGSGAAARITRRSAAGLGRLGAPRLGFICRRNGCPAWASRQTR